MEDSATRSPAVWDGRGGVRPERLAKRRRLANRAAAAALLIAVPAAVGSSAGWWESGEAMAGPGSVAEVAAAGAETVDLLAPDLLAIGAGTGPDGQAAGVEMGAGVRVGPHLLDGDFDPDDGCVDGPAGEPVVIGVVVDPVSAGRDDAVALEVAAGRYVTAAVNCAGGVIGRPVEIAVAGSSAAARQGVVELMEVGASVVVGPSPVELALRTAGAAGGRVAVLSPLSVEPALAAPDRGLFLIDPDGVALAEGAARHARQQGWRTAVVMTGSDPLEDLVAGSFERAFTAAGGSVTAQLPLVVDADGSIDLTNQLRRLGRGPVPQPGPDLVFSPVGPATAGDLRSGLMAAELDVPVLGLDRRQVLGGGSSLDNGDDVAAGAVIDARGLGSDAVLVDGVEIVGRPSVDIDGRVARLLDAVGSSNPSASEDPVAVVRLADAFLIAVDAIGRAGTSDTGEVLDRLAEGETVDGVVGVTGVWRGSLHPEDWRPVPVVGVGLDGSTVAATVPPSGG